MNAHEPSMGESIRLHRETSIAGQAGCATLLGSILALMGIAAAIVMWNDSQGTGKNGWVLYVVGFGFGFVGLLVAGLGIKMFLMTRIPETIVEVETVPVHAGQSFQLTVRQPGPIRLKSLRVNLVCEQITSRRTERAGGPRTNKDRRIIHQANVLDLGESAAGPGEQIVGHATVSVPADVRYADIEGQKAIVWRLEVWGRVRGWADFGHPYIIEVSDD
jgi:hypothetical protein